MTVNRQKVVDTNLDHFSEDAEKVPGPNSITGHIGLQSRGDQISFRSIRLREIGADANNDEKTEK